MHISYNSTLVHETQRFLVFCSMFPKLIIKHPVHRKRCALYYLMISNIYWVSSYCFAIIHSFTVSAHCKLDNCVYIWHIEPQMMLEQTIRCERIFDSFVTIFTTHSINYLSIYINVFSLNFRTSSTINVFNVIAFCVYIFMALYK